MAISIEFADESDLQQACIKVVGVGGGGGNAVNTMISAGLEGVEFLAANTDVQALANNAAGAKIQIGPNLTKGLGAGANPDVGRKAALEDLQRMAEALHGADMVFVTAGMGGGTGTGAAPVIAQIARDQGALTVGVVTKPFLFEGRRRSRNAEQGIRELAEAVDTIITIPNQKLLSLSDEDMSMLDAFRRADDVLLQAVRGISDLIVHAGMINVDFADVKTIMSNTGRALMGTGYGKGERRALDAAEMAIHSPLLDNVSVEGATGILINFTGGADLRLREVNEAASLVHDAAHEDANIIFGVVTDPDMGDTVKVTVIATGFDTEARAHDEWSSRGIRANVPSSIPAVQARQSSLPPAHVPAWSEARDRDAGTRDMISARPPRRPSDYPAPFAAQEPARLSRPFGATALHDETVLDIPAYLRRNMNAQE